LGIVIFGLFLIGSGNLFQRGLEKPHLRGVTLALSLAVLISIYSTIDGAAVKLTPPFSYAVILFFLSPVLTSPLMFRYYGWQILQTELACNWGRILSIGLLTVGAYLLALVAYSMASISYVGAVREVSIVMGALAGWRFLKERLGGWRVVGSVVIFCGILVIALFG
jgi:drug/metabolite transporter (DMT)-like permease